MSTAPPVPPRPYDSHNPAPPLPPLPPDILLGRYNTESESLPHFEKPLIAPKPHHVANVSRILSMQIHALIHLLRWPKHWTISCQVLGHLLLTFPPCDPWQILLFNLLLLLFFPSLLLLLLSLQRRFLPYPPLFPSLLNFSLQLVPYNHQPTIQLSK